jgi:diacylglycerol kinase (ATP)
VSANSRPAIVGGEPKSKGWLRLLRATLNSLEGLRAAWREEEAFRLECYLAIVMLPLGVWLGRSGIERALLVGTVFLVLIVELLNSAVEAAVDRIGVERHHLSGLAKDQGSAAVFMADVLLVVVWLLVLLDR